LTYSGFADTVAIEINVTNDTLKLTPQADWNGSSVITAIVSDGMANDSTTFTLTVMPVNDMPTTFTWNTSIKRDSIDISGNNLDTEYTISWLSSKDVDGDTLKYYLQGIGNNEGLVDIIVDTVYTFKYQYFTDHWPTDFQMLPRMVFKFTVWGHSGSDSIQITGDPFELLVNRYEYLSTESELIPTEYALHQNYPNPFNPITTIKFDLPEPGEVTLSIFNIMGQEIKVFHYQNMSPGYYTLNWNATNDFGESVGAGVYLYQLRANNFVKTKKMVLLK